MGNPNLPERAPAHTQVVAPELIQERNGTFALLGSHVRNGEWELPRFFRALSVMGNVELDLCRVRLGPGTSHIEVMAIMGNIEIKVPPDVRLECDGHPGPLGSFEVKRKVASTLSPDAPLIRITGTAYASSVEVTVVDPNAPGMLEKLYARWAGKKPDNR